MRIDRKRATLVTLTALVLASFCGASSASAVVGHEFERSFGPDCTEATRFIGPGAVTVDEATHDIYVPEQEAGVWEVFRCTTNGTEALFSAGPRAGANDGCPS